MNQRQHCRRRRRPTGRPKRWSRHDSARPHLDHHHSDAVCHRDPRRLRGATRDQRTNGLTVTQPGVDVLPRSGPDQPGLVDGDLAAPQEQGADVILTPGVPPAASAAVPPVPSAEQTQLRELFLADPPTGTGPQIALRFLQALQAGQDFTAAHELYIAGRTLLAQHDLAFLQQVMDDIRNNAGLSAAPRCSTATPVNAEASAVRCGQLTVVVHVMADEYGSGVQISDAHPAGDSYRAPHRHAFTLLEL